MQLAEFERAARTLWNGIPAEYKEGVDGLVIDESAVAHPEHSDVYTLGECLTEDYPSQYGGPETTRSAVVLYYGSFRAVADDDPSFDWQEEIHETVMHELQHHLEALATESGLEDVDYAVDENFKRIDGEPFDPLFFRAGERVADGTYRVEADVFFEVLTADGTSLPVDLEFDDLRFQVQIPASSADVLFVYVEQGPVVEGDVCVVRVRKRGVLGTLRAAMQGSYSIEETTVVAERIS